MLEADSQSISAALFSSLLRVKANVEVDAELGELPLACFFQRHATHLPHCSPGCLKYPAIVTVLFRPRGEMSLFRPGGMNRKACAGQDPKPVACLAVSASKMQAYKRLRHD